MNYESVKWYINNTCNLNCSFCFAQNIKEQNNSLEDKYKILDKLYKDKVANVDFFGKEPLLNEDIFKIMKYGESKNYDFYYSFISNGKNLKKYTNQLIDSPCREFTISYDFHKGEREYQFDLADLALFKDSFFIELSVDLYEANMEEILSEVKNLYSLGVNSLYFNPIMPIVGSDLKALSEDTYFSFINSFLSACDDNLYFTFKIPYQMKELTTAFQDSDWCDTEPFCSAGKSHFCISCSGRAYGCVSQCAIANLNNSCDYLSTPFDELYEILSSHTGRLCI